MTKREFGRDPVLFEEPAHESQRFPVVFGELEALGARLLERPGLRPVGGIDDIAFLIGWDRRHLPSSLVRRFVRRSSGDQRGWTNPYT